MTKDEIWLSDQDPNKGLCLSLWSDDIDRIEKFKGLCYLNLPEDLKWFHQCNSRSYQMFEFWKPNSVTARDVGLLISVNLELPYVEKLSVEPTGVRAVEIKEFRFFEPHFHTFDNFFG